MAYCCYCGRKTGFSGTTLKDGYSICSMCSYICSQELIQRGIIKSSSELSNWDKNKILNFFNKDSIDNEELSYFGNELSNYLANLKTSYPKTYSWIFFGEQIFKETMQKVNTSFWRHRGDEIPVAFKDTTIFGNAKAGILITTKRIYSISLTKFEVFLIKDIVSISATYHKYDDTEKYIVRFCADAYGIDLCQTDEKDVNKNVLFWGNLFSFLVGKKTFNIKEFKNMNKTKTDKTFKISKVSSKESVEKNGLNSFQEKMLKFLLENSFSEYDRHVSPPLNDWGYIPANSKIIACEKFSWFSWKHYAFYTHSAIYYHNQKSKVHSILNYDEINGYNANTGILDYGDKHEFISITLWEDHVKTIIEKICYIKANGEDETDTSIFEFCFNNCETFRSDLQYFKRSHIENVFKSHSQNKHKSIQENWKHITINKIENGVLQLQFWEYFSNPTMPTINEYDSEYEIQEKQREAERRQDEAEKEQLSAERASYELVEHSEDIVTTFKDALYELYGICFKRENIVFLDYPDFTFEGPSFIDRIESVANSALSYANEVAERNSKNINNH